MYRCPFCGRELHWHNDFDAEDIGYDFIGVVSYRTCGDCGIDVKCITNCEEDAEEEITFVVTKMEEDEPYEL